MATQRPQHTDCAIGSRRAFAAVVLAAFGAWAAGVSGSAHAASILIDTDPTLAGIQTSRVVTQGSSFSVDIILSAAGSISGFATEGGDGGGFLADGAPEPFSFDDSILTGLSVNDAGFLPGPFAVSNESISGGQAFFNRAPSGFGVAALPASSSGVLFSVDFIATATGTTDVGFLGTNLFVNSIGLLDDVNFVVINQLGSSGTVEVVPVPEPSTFWLVAWGTLALASRTRCSNTERNQRKAIP